MTPRVLSIAGTDPTGGAGIQADLKSIGAMGGYGMAAVTALVAQNTCGVRSVHVPPVSFLTEQLQAVSDDVTIDAVKLGMLHSRPLIGAVDDWLARVRPPVVVLDPVMVATSGDRLLDADAEAGVRRLCRRVDLVTPNIPELAVLLDTAPATSWAEAVRQATDLATRDGLAVLLKGGHLDGPDCHDAIVTSNSIDVVTAPRIRTTTTHGTGCSLSAAMATLRASGLTWVAALERAKSWLTGAIEHGPALRVGLGNGPVDHFHAWRDAAPHDDRWSTGVWRDAADVRGRVEACEFVRRLGDGTLEPERFAWYLEQDALYLAEYAGLLERAAALAPDEEERLFWSGGAVAARAEVTRLHASWTTADMPVARATRAYLDHLDDDDHREHYTRLVAAVLPCYWLYAHVGTMLVDQDHPDHTYGTWLRMYAEPAFTEAAGTARAIADRSAASASPAERGRMRAVFDASMRHELAFFEAP